MNKSSPAGNPLSASPKSSTTTEAPEAASPDNGSRRNGPSDALWAKLMQCMKHEPSPPPSWEEFMAEQIAEGEFMKKQGTALKKREAATAGGGSNEAHSKIRREPNRH